VGREEVSSGVETDDAVPGECNRGVPVVSAPLQRGIFLCSVPRRYLFFNSGVASGSSSQRLSLGRPSDSRLFPPRRAALLLLLWYYASLLGEVAPRGCSPSAVTAEQDHTSTSIWQVRPMLISLTSVALCYQTS
jgi:hypothetical protein